jgi:hypothetical protein
VISRLAFEGLPQKQNDHPAGKSQKKELTMEEVYITFPLCRNEIRILTLLASNDHEAQIQCELKKVSLEEKPEYVALSYPWGTQKPTHAILVNGQEFSATSNLQDALQHLRIRNKEQKTLGLWVDAIFINQNDAAESLEQIKLMHKIFSEARCIRKSLC